jgi:hypothetical protein
MVDINALVATGAQRKKSGKFLKVLQSFDLKSVST